MKRCVTPWQFLRPACWCKKSTGRSGWNREYKLIYYFFLLRFLEHCPAPELGQGLPRRRGMGAHLPHWSCSFQDGRSVLELQGQARFSFRCPQLALTSQQNGSLAGAYRTNCERAQLLGKTQRSASLEGSKGLLKPWATLLAQIIFSSALG